MAKCNVKEQFKIDPLLGKKFSDELQMTYDHNLSFFIKSINYFFFQNDLISNYVVKNVHVIAKTYSSLKKSTIPATFFFKYIYVQFNNTIMYFTPPKMDLYTSAHLQKIEPVYERI